MNWLHTTWLFDLLAAPLAWWAGWAYGVRHCLNTHHRRAMEGWFASIRHHEKTLAAWNADRERMGLPSLTEADLRGELEAGPPP